MNADRIAERGVRPGFGRPALGIACWLVAALFLRAQEEPQLAAGSATARMSRVDQSNRPVPVIPTPQEVYWGMGDVAFGPGGACTIEMPAGGRTAELLPADFKRRLSQRWAMSPDSGAGGLRFVFAVDPRGLPGESDLAGKLRGLGPEAYVLTVAPSKTGPEVLIVGNSPVALWHGMATAAGLVRRQGAQWVFPRVEIVDYPRIRDRALLVDVGGQGFMVGPSRWSFGQWKEFVDWMVDHKLNDIWLEFIGSGRLMGNLDPNAGQWIGYPMDLKSYPQLVGRDRPIQRWDETRQKTVADRYTIPNVTHDFVRELIDYAQARGVRCDLLIGWDYFANQMPVVLHLPANDPLDPAANRVYDDLLRETVIRYSNASGVVLVTIENKDVPPQMLSGIIRRAHDADRIIKAINPRMEIALLPDYLEWRPQRELELLKQGLPADMVLAYSPHRQPQQKAWKRIFGDVWRFQLYSQYAWDHVAYIMPEQIQKEAFSAIGDGYDRMVSQAWYFDVYAVNYLAMAEYAWNPTSGSVDAFWDKAMTEEFGSKAAAPMRAALAHTRFDLRFDIIARILSRPNLESPFSFWDMYTLTRIDRLTDGMLGELEVDARQSLDAARTAEPLVPESAREMVKVTLISAERRLYLATSARHLLKALAAKKSGDLPKARSEMELCIQEGEKMVAAATGLGIEFPTAVHDVKVLDRYRAIQAGLR